MDETALSDEAYLREAIELSAEALHDDAGGPFGAVVAHGGHVIARGRNRVLVDRDPTAHAEIVAIRAAAAHLGDHVLQGCVLYTSCEPCPMCLAALRWARIERVVFACTRADAAAAGFDDERFYGELEHPGTAETPSLEQALAAEGRRVMAAWARRPDRRPY